MEIHGELTEEDNWEAQGLPTHRAPWVDAVILGVFALLFYLDFSDGKYTSAILWVAMSLMMISPRFLMLPRFVKRAFIGRSHRKKTLPVMREVKVTAGRIIISGPDYSRSLNLKTDLRRYWVGKTVILTADHYNDMLVFPKRWFTAEQLREFLSYLEARGRLPAGQKPLPPPPAPAPNH